MIGGNVKAILQISNTSKNEIGESVQIWNDVIVLTGWLDFQAGDSKRTTYNAKMQETTHIFICDYKPIPDTLEIEGRAVRVTAENSRIVVNGASYDVMVIDNPMGLNKQLEIYLKYTGGQ